MRKFILFLIFASTISLANAWVPRSEEGILLFATKYLTPQAKSLVDIHFGESYRDDVQYLYNLEKKEVAKHTKEIHYVHLNKNLKPANVEGDDALKALEGALAVVRNHQSHSSGEVKTAMRIVANLICDIHNFSQYRIKGIPHSYNDFEFTRNRRDYGPDINEKVPIKWSHLWNSFGYRHKGFSASLWAEDMELSSGDKFEEYSQGTLREWVEQNGAKAAAYLEVYAPRKNVTTLAYNELEDVNYDMMVRAGYRFAKLLNDAVK